MHDTIADTPPDRRPAIVICAWDADDPVWDPVEDLSGEAWSPSGARTVAVPPSDPESLAATLAAHLRDTGTRALLLIGRSRHAHGFQVQIRAENRALTGGHRVDGIGPSVARATAPVADMVRALAEEGLQAEATSEAEHDVGSYLLYRVLSGLAEDLDTPAVGLLRAPTEGDDGAVQRAVKTTAQAMARHLSPLPRARG
jgi:pyrrolidone-carboxylate peptidase